MNADGIGLVGPGKIARDQHLPAIAADPAFRLAAVTSRRGLTEAGTAGYTDHRDMLRSPDVAAVVVCTPPAAHYEVARDALRAGRHVLLEKPPTTTLGELDELARLAEACGRTLFATWHARHNPAVEEARAILAGRTVRAMRVTWKEDVRRWHPGQAWIWQPGGFGVFDPGINALSIATRILPGPILVDAAELAYPANRDAPIAARLRFRPPEGEADLRAEFDWRQTGPQTWDIVVETEDGSTLRLSGGGRRLDVDGACLVDAPSREYPLIYECFARLIAEGRSDVDAGPLRLVADAFTIARRSVAEPFDD